MNDEPCLKPEAHFEAITAILKQIPELASCTPIESGVVALSAYVANECYKAFIRGETTGLEYARQMLPDLADRVTISASPVGRHNVGPYTTDECY